MRSLIPLFLSVVLIFPSVARGEKEQVTVGVIAPLTGSVATYGVETRRAIELLTPVLNEHSSKYHYRFVLEDGKCGAGNSAVTAAHKLINVEQARFIIATCSGEVMQIAPLVESRKVIAIGTAASHPDVKMAGDFVFRTYADIDSGVDAIVQTVKARNHLPLAVLTEENAFTFGIRDLLQRSLGESIIYSDEFRADESDFRSILSRARQKNPAAYYINSATPITYPVLFSQLRQLGIQAPVYSYFQPSVPDVLKALSTKQNGVVFIQAPRAKSPSPEFEQFYRDKYLKAYPQGPEIEFLFRTSYDAIRAIEAAVETVGNRAEPAKDFLYQYEAKGAVGNVKFDRNGDIEGVVFELDQIVDGKPVPFAIPARHGMR